jgi:hypothetical protein
MYVPCTCLEMHFTNYIMYKIFTIKTFKYIIDMLHKKSIINSTDYIVMSWLHL